MIEQGWCGIWIEGSEAGGRAAEVCAEPIREGRLKIVQALATVDNINRLLDTAGVPDRIDFLSLDIDYNGTRVWIALQRKCRLGCIEYNASLPPSLDLAAPYDPARAWDGTRWFGGGSRHWS